MNLSLVRSPPLARKHPNDSCNDEPPRVYDSNATALSNKHAGQVIRRCASVFTDCYWCVPRRVGREVGLFVPQRQYSHTCKNRWARLISEDGVPQESIS